MSNETQWTPGPWHVNGIDSKRGRITGDETSDGWDKLQINSANATVATVYRGKDARLIAAAPEMAELLERIAFKPIGEPEASDRAILDTITDEARALLAKIKGITHA